METKYGKAINYIRFIKNEDKKEYAHDYWRFLVGHSLCPQRPETLSYMAAQAVRLRLELINGEVKLCE